MTLDKFFDDITEVNLQQLLGKKMAGYKTVSYQEGLPGDQYESQKDFLAEVSSFANTTGGHILYGIKEENGIPVALPGVPGKNLDRDIHRLEKLLKDNLQPRCPGVTFRTIERTANPPIVVVRISESWSKLHVVDFQGHWRFYARNSTGKYPLGMKELKSALLAATGLGERIRNFHFDRLSKISSDEVPVPLSGKIRTAFHLIPYSAFESDSSLSFTMEDIWSVPLLHGSVSGYHSHLDGMIVYHEKGEKNFSEGYTQVFRNGILESVQANLFGSSLESSCSPSATFEADVTTFLDDCLAFYRKLSIRPPTAFLVSVMGVRDCDLVIHRRLDTRHNHAKRFNKDLVLLPEVIVENLAVNTTTLLKPIFRAIGNSARWERLYRCEKAGEKDLIFT